MAENKAEALKIQYQTLISEYQVMRQSVQDYRSMQGQLDSITLAALGISIPVILTILERSMEYVGVILLIPILFFAVAFTQLRYERMVTIAATYIDANLRPQIEQILSKLSKEKLPVLQWEKYLAGQNITNSLLIGWVALCLRSILSFGTGIGVIGIYAFIRISQPQGMQLFEVYLLVVDGILFIGDLAFALMIARQRGVYNKKNSYEK